VDLDAVNAMKPPEALKGAHQRRSTLLFERLWRMDDSFERKNAKGINDFEAVVPKVLKWSYGWGLVSAFEAREFASDVITPTAAIHKEVHAASPLQGNARAADRAGRGRHNRRMSDDDLLR
jgi:hypothetical protein